MKLAMNARRRELTLLTLLFLAHKITYRETDVCNTFLIPNNKQSMHTDISG